jgi:hypothetical protein
MSLERTITYQVCETGSNPLMCTAQATVVVNEVPAIASLKQLFQ